MQALQCNNSKQALFFKSIDQMRPSPALSLYTCRRIPNMPMAPITIYRRKSLSDGGDPAAYTYIPSSLRHRGYNAQTPHPIANKYIVTHYLKFCRVCKRQVYSNLQRTALEIRYIRRQQAELRHCWYLR